MATRSEKQEKAFSDLKAGDGKWGTKLAGDDGLYMHAKTSGKYWRMSYRFNGVRKVLALGVYPKVSLTDAKAEVVKATALLDEGKDPNQEKRKGKIADKAASEITFEDVAAMWLTKTTPKRSDYTQQKVARMLAKDINPFIGAMPIGSITAQDVMDKAITRLEKKGVIETSYRVKMVIGQVFRFAMVLGKAKQDVTAALSGAMTAKAVKHHAAIVEPKAFGALLRSIHSYSGNPVVVAALKFSPLVFCRPGEIRKAEWSEIDFAAGQWVIPASKMKMRKVHIVPLAKQAIQILKAIEPFTRSGTYVFPSIRGDGRPMSENTINSALRALGYDKDTHNAHGFRASARTLLDEVLGERVDLIEHQLSHQVLGSLGRAYDRTSHLPARREMMQRWADYLDKLRMGAEVIRLHGGA